MSTARLTKPTGRPGRAPDVPKGHPPRVQRHLRQSVMTIGAPVERSGLAQSASNSLWIEYCPSDRGQATEPWPESASARDAHRECHGGTPRVRPCFIAE